MNAKLGNVGKTVFYTDPVTANPVNQAESLKDLVADMRAGKVDLLVILDGNPVYDAPADLGFADALQNTKIPLRVHLGLYQDETAELCHWHINQAHYLEAWGDARAYDGTVSIVQPLLAPLYEGKSAPELLATLSGQPDTPGHDIVQGYWKKQHPAADFDMFWRKSLHDGWVEGTAFAAKQFAIKPGKFPEPSSYEFDSIEINFRRDPSIYDGQFSNNGWLQELPKPMTKMTWDNPVLVGPAMAARLGLKTEDLIKITLNGQSVTAPVWIQAGHADNSITVFLGYGRRRAGRAGTGAGFDSIRCNQRCALVHIGCERRQNRRYVQISHYTGLSDDGNSRWRLAAERAHAQHRGVSQGAELRPQKKFLQGSLTSTNPTTTKRRSLRLGHVHRPERLRGLQRLHPGLPGGKQHSRRGQSNRSARPPHALDPRGHLYQRDRDNPEPYFQPVPCMQCENAPCELVCPVRRHDAQHRRPERHGLQPLRGHPLLLQQLSLQGAPLQFSAVPGLEHAQPEDACATRMSRVRSRGVMEKCTYCVQRINAPNIDAEEQDRDIARRRDSDRVPAGLSRRRPSFSATSTTQQPRRQAKGEKLELRPAGRSEHAAANHLSGGAAQSQSGIWKARRAKARCRGSRGTDEPRRTPAGVPSSAGAGPRLRHRHRQNQLDRVLPRTTPHGWWFVGFAVRLRCWCMLLLYRRRLICSIRASASGESTSPWPGALPSSTLCGGSESAMPAR